jgi:hypothetical protein
MYIFKEISSFSKICQEITPNFYELIRSFALHLVHKHSRKILKTIQYPRFQMASMIPVPDRRKGYCLGPKGNRVNSAGGWGRARPSRQRARYKHLTTSREGVNSSMEQEEEGKKSQAWQRGPIVHRVSITLMFFVRACKYYQATMHVEFVVILVYLFQENKSYGVELF